MHAPGCKVLIADTMHASGMHMQSTIAIQKIAAYPLDIEIIIARNVCGTYDFDCFQEMIDLGYQKTLETVISH